MVPFKAAKMAKSFIADTDTFDDLDGDTTFMILNVSSHILKKVINYCKRYQVKKMHEITTPFKGEQIADTMKPDWDVNYCENLEFETLFNIITAANYMNIMPLLDLCCFVVAFKVKGKSTHEICEIFNMFEPRPHANDGVGGDGQNCGDEDMD